MAYGALTQYGGQAVSNVKLPDKIKCARCRVIKAPSAFAANRQSDLKTKIKNEPRFNATTQGHIVCLQCTQVGGNVVELLCHSCDKVKSKDAFSKAQRKNPDKAQCWPCLEARLNTEPGDDSSDSSGSGGSSEDDSDDSYGGGTVTNDLGNLSIHGASEAGGTSVGYGTNTSGVGNSSGGVALSSRFASDTVSVADSTVTNRTTTSPPHLRKRAPASVAGSDISSFSNFAKVRAAPQKIRMDAAQQVRDQDKAAKDDVCVADSDSDTDSD